MISSQISDFGFMPDPEEPFRDLSLFLGPCTKPIPAPHSRGSFQQSSKVLQMLSASLVPGHGLWLSPGHCVLEAHLLGALGTFLLLCSLLAAVSCMCQRTAAATLHIKGTMVTRAEGKVGEEPPVLQNLLEQWASLRSFPVFGV